MSGTRGIRIHACRESAQSWHTIAFNTLWTAILLLQSASDHLHLFSFHTFSVAALVMTNNRIVTSLFVARLTLSYFTSTHLARLCRARTALVIICIPNRRNKRTLKRLPRTWPLWVIINLSWAAVLLWWPPTASGRDILRNDEFSFGLVHYNVVTWGIAVRIM